MILLFIEEVIDTIFNQHINVDTKEKQMQETESLRRTGASFKKMVIVRNNIVPRYDDDGILYIGIEDFLLDETSIDL